LDVSDLTRPKGLPRAGFTPADTMAHGRMTRRYRLTVDASLLPQSACNPRLGVRELGPLGPNPTTATADTVLRIDQRHWVCRSGQIIPGQLLRRPYTGGPSTHTHWTDIVDRVPSSGLAVDSAPHVLAVDRRKPESGQAQIHVQSRHDPARPPLLVAQTADSSAVRTGGRVLPQIDRRSLYSNR
jgi:hypothetical protein